MGKIEQSADGKSNRLEIDFLLHRFQIDYPPVANLLGRISRFFFWNTMGAAAVIFPTGGMRTFTYIDIFYGPEAERVRRKMLVVKHVVLIAIFAVGSYWAYTMSFH